MSGKCFGGLNGPPLAHEDVARHEIGLPQSVAERLGVPARSRSAVSGRSAHIFTLVLSPTSETRACTGPAGSTSSVKRARQTRDDPSADCSLPPSREISNWATAVPCGVANGISKLQRGC